MELIFTILSELGYPVSQEIQDYYDNIQLWEDWWKGYDPKFHRYRITDGEQSMMEKRKQMRMAKTVCEDWANLLLNDKTRILIECDDHDTNVTQKWLTGDEAEQNGGILGANRFWVRGNKAIEREFAQGTVCFYWQLTGSTVQAGKLSATGLTLKVIKDAQMIVPLSYTDEDIQDIALASSYVKAGQPYLYLQVFEKHPNNDGYTISNHYYQVNGGGTSYSPAPAPNGEVESYELPCKPFVIMKPNLENSIADVPLGMSVYANALDELKSCDLAYDNMFMDTLLGKKRIFMDQAAICLHPPVTVKDEDGHDRVLRQEPDTELTLEKSLYVKTGEQLPGDQKFFEEYNPSLRTDENKENVQFNLNLLSMKVGLGQNRYQFNQQSMATATQVRASNKELTESVWKQRIVIQDALTELTRQALILGKEKLHQPLDVDARITIQFDDTMFSDEEAERVRFMQEIAAGIRQKWEYRVKYDGESEEEARKMTGETDSETNEGLAGQFAGDYIEAPQNGQNEPTEDEVDD